MKTFILALVLFCGIPESYCSVVMLKVNAVISEGSCDVNVDDTNQDIDLGSVSSSAFTRVGEVSASAKSFTVRLQNCSGNFNAISTVFSGTSDADEPSLLALSPNSSAQGIGIQILDANSNPLNITQTATAGRMQENPSMTYQLRYKATQIPVQPGTANGTLFLNFFYQ